MGKMKDEFFDEFYSNGKYPLKYDSPQWHAPNPNPKQPKPNGGGHPESINSIKKQWGNYPLNTKVTPKSGNKIDFNIAIDTKLNNTKFIIDVLGEFKKAVLTFVKKHEDYGSTNISNAPGGALNGLAVRLHDKIARLSNLNGNKEPNYESLYDTFMDIANYGIIGMLVLEDKWDKG